MLLTQCVPSTISLPLSGIERIVCEDSKEEQNSFLLFACELAQYLPIFTGVGTINLLTVLAYSSIL
jgi:hypothetical protein